MVYESDKMTYRSVMKVFSGKVNDVEICESVENGRSTYYTVLIVKDHDTVKKLIRVLEAADSYKDRYVEMFDSSRGFCVVFDYVKERKLSDFFIARDMPLSTCEEICINLVIACMTCNLPLPILELVIVQKQIHLLKDNSVVLGYSIDLEELNVEAGEAECAVQCSLVVRDMLEKKISKKNIGYKLLAKKIPRQSYSSIRELYKDIRLATSSEKKKGLFSRIRTFFIKHDSAIFRIIITVCVILIILALLMLISQLIWGEVPFLRIFFNTFKKIGTESLID